MRLEVAVTVVLNQREGRCVCVCVCVFVYMGEVNRKGGGLEGEMKNNRAEKGIMM